MASTSSDRTTKADLVSDVSRTDWFKAPTEWPPKQLAASVDSESDADSESSWDSEREAAEAQAQYEESIRQLHLIVSIVALPYFAKYFGRKAAYWLFGRYQLVGLGKQFWLGSLSRFAPATWP